ncbi:terminase small subunit [Nitratidesulfovibrio liaohensis]|uniref:Terminase small subunit n=1 Tax=Nitratidesulfovibrio liaohensis TaxID=2604158 RepID=A0ABY9R7R4_9BACT|nr:terminase small subunit [Nitratidesulfovibrio liaohensis]WMW66734.1 terminase small subunit [Nitratidesulfovibrio liaohensis]
MSKTETSGEDSGPQSTGRAGGAEGTGPSRCPAGTQREGNERSPRLGVRQRRFVEEFLVDMSPVRAAERAGYAPVRAARTASRLLGSPTVQLAVEQAMARRATRTGVTQDRVVRELAAVGFAVMTDLCHWSDEGVRLRDSTELTRAQAAAVAEVREASTARTARGTRTTRPARGPAHEPEEAQPEPPVRGGVQVKLHSKLKALEMLARHLGMFGSAATADGDAPPDGGNTPPELPPELRARIDALYPRHGADVVRNHGGGYRDDRDGAEDDDEEDWEDREDSEDTAHGGNGGFGGDGWRLA